MTTIYIQKHGMYYYPCYSPHDYNEVLFDHLFQKSFHEDLYPIFEVLAKAHGWDVVIEH